ncbi:MFS transporter [Oleiphilus sp. HI0009]|uniref:cytochrome c oxidase subunit 3 n=1 Tax=unclassified Oleiphilus TaxID=2631174 RepID=UPI0007C2062B|nr:MULTISPECIES: cytochrome c oxidase subunit 3 [unclassified Oleiphilus]KZX72606.1 MFS transporter [Oleiphilus sp. HI0009]KZY70663.1 MFS transporter [Oleiphilus sp. HI0066]KZY71338.1 MFS transporter [Oleiphilus sp. HI0067]MCH2158344.1 cytochrome c oxidase subunit 3 [Oleiphilaceae bacterium]
MSAETSYYVPAQSRWPIVATVGLFLTVVGAGSVMNASSAGESTGMSWLTFMIGALIMAYMLFGWFGHVIQESQQGLYSEQMDRSFRWGMSWFIFSEVMFFAAFFGALFYIRVLAVPWIGGEGANTSTGELLWPEFEATWPLMVNPNNELYPGPSALISPWGIPLLNTALLVASSVTITIAHHALKDGDRGKLTLWLGATIALGVVFLYFQGYEYVHAYNDLDLTLSSGIYGTTFFLLTGFHGAHVTLGTLMLIIMFFRVRKGHFDKANHFGFEATAWYWHFVDVVWLGLFFLVYIL